MSKKNNTPYESDEQVAFVDYLTAKGFVFNSTPNGMFLGDNDAKFAYMEKMKSEGLNPGFPDLTIFANNGRHPCLYLEMKRQEGGKLSLEQEWWIDFLDKRGDAVAVAKGCEKAIKILDNYLEGNY